MTNQNRSRDSRLIAFQRTIYQATRHAPRPYSSLMPWVLDRRNLDAAWKRVRLKGGTAPGIDGQISSSVANPSEWLSQLAQDLLDGVWQPSPPRWVDVPKNDGPLETRRLGILTIRDRVVHTALKQVLEPIVEPGMHQQSHGFRAGRSVPSALTAAINRLNSQARGKGPYEIAAHLDVAKCFDSLDHVVLSSQLAQHVGDKEFLRLVRLAVQSPSSAIRRTWFHRPSGIIQGSPLSPLLCNLYLQPLDEQLGELAQSTDAAVFVIRYADDLLLLARNRSWARKAIRCAIQCLNRLHLKLGRKKQSIRSLKLGIRWLGVIVQPQPRVWAKVRAYGYWIPDDKLQRMLETVTEMTQIPSEKVSRDSYNLGEWVGSLNEQLHQWRSTYRFAENATQTWQMVDDHARDAVRRLLTRLTGLRGNHLNAAHRVRLPRGYWTWQANGVQLVNLAAIPNRNAGITAKRPEWQRGTTASPQSYDLAT